MHSQAEKIIVAPAHGREPCDVWFVCASVVDQPPFVVVICPRLTEELLQIFPRRFVIGFEIHVMFALAATERVPFTWKEACLAIGALMALGAQVNAAEVVWGATIGGTTLALLGTHSLRLRRKVVSWQ